MKKNMCAYICFAYIDIYACVCKTHNFLHNALCDLTCTDWFVLISSTFCNIKICVSSFSYFFPPSTSVIVMLYVVKQILFFFSFKNRWSESDMKEKSFLQLYYYFFILFGFFVTDKSTDKPGTIFPFGQYPI